MSDSNNNEDEVLKKYIEKLLNFENRNKLTQKDLEKIANDMGLNKDDLKAVESKAVNHMKKGEGFLSHQCYDEAIEEFSQAYSLSPLNTSIIQGLSRSYFYRFIEKKQKTDRENALKYANIGIEINPDLGEFYKIIQDINKGSSPGFLSKLQEKSKKDKFKRIIVLLILLALALTAYLLNQNYSKIKDSLNKNKETRINENTFAEKENEAEPGEIDIPVEFESGGRVKNINFNKDTSMFNRYDDSYSYEIKGEVFCPDEEVVKLTFKLSLIDNMNNVIVAKFIEALSDSDEAVYPGDSIPVNLLVYEDEKPPKIREALLSIYFAKTSPRAGNYELKNELSVKWEAVKPDNTDIGVYLRSTDYHKGFGTKYHFLVLRIKNIGSRQIKHMKLGAKWFDKNGKELISNYVYPVTNSNAPVNPGVTRTSRIIGSFPSDMPDFDRYELSVQEIN